MISTISGSAFQSRHCTIVLTFQSSPIHGSGRYNVFFLSNSSMEKGKSFGEGSVSVCFVFRILHTVNLTSIGRERLVMLTKPRSIMIREGHTNRTIVARNNKMGSRASREIDLYLMLTQNFFCNYYTSFYSWCNCLWELAKIRGFFATSILLTLVQSAVNSPSPIPSQHLG